MKVLSLVTLISPLGEYGGPVRVAVNQAQAMIDRGHDVRIVGGCRGFNGEPPSDIEGVPASLFPTRQVVPRTGFAGLTAPGLFRWLSRHLADIEVLHAHLARDLVTLPAVAQARRRGIRYVAQTHGMIDKSANPLAIPLDRLLSVPALQGAAHVLYLTEAEKRGLSEVAGDLRMTHVPNGVPPAEGIEPAEPPEVLYLARLAERKRPVLFVTVAMRLAAEFPEVRFRMVGPDEGEGPAVGEAIARARAAGVDIQWEGALSPADTVKRMRRAAVYTLPSVDEPYPMSVLEAMSVGLPVIITDSCGLAGFVHDHQAGLVVGPEEHELIAGLRTLLSNRDRARLTGERGRAAVRSELGMAAIAEQLETLYRG